MNFNIVMGILSESNAMLRDLGHKTFNYKRLAVEVQACLASWGLCLSLEVDTTCIHPGVTMTVTLGPINAMLQIYDMEHHTQASEAPPWANGEFMGHGVISMDSPLGRELQKFVEQVKDEHTEHVLDHLPLDKKTVTQVNEQLDRLRKGGGL